jgi:hypothetical protein
MIGTAAGGRASTSPSPNWTGRACDDLHAAFRRGGFDTRNCALVSAIIRHVRRGLMRALSDLAQAAVTEYGHPFSAPAGDGAWVGAVERQPCLLARGLPIALGHDPGPVRAAAGASPAASPVPCMRSRQPHAAAG